VLPAAETLRTTVGDIDLAYQTLGRPTDPPVLLISGLGGQLISWEDDFCRELVGRGLFVIRFDNRDVGLSTHLGDGASYRLSDMAADTAGLVENLGLGSAHVVGVSLGGMVAQTLAIEHPHRVRSLTSIMSTTGDPQVGQATEVAFGLLLMPPVTSREDAMERAVLGNGVLGSPGYPATEDELRDKAARAFDRAFDPHGVARQLAAARSAPDRTEQLRQLRLPTVVIHGADDPLIGVSGGHATAEAVPGAELVLLDGMGHELPRAVWPAVVDRIAALVGRAEQRR
jgi:pimeloyl-ACP methyl ester carboxylesterase